MTDDTSQQRQNAPAAKKDDKRPPSNGAGNNRNPRRNPSTSKPASGSPASQGAPNRPNSQGSNRRPQKEGAADSGNESSGKKAGDNRRNEPQRNKSQGGGANRNGHRKTSSSAPGNRQGGNSQPGSAAQSPASGVPSSESSDALSSLQRVIADLKTSTSPPNQLPSMPSNNSLSTSSSGSSLPVNAPVFQPGAAMFPAHSVQEPPPRHRKAASLGASGLSNNFNNFAPHLGSMMEDVEEGPNGGYEEGEIPENVYSTQGHHPRSQSQNFTAPRFAALAAQQQEQADVLGPSGRPQLAPNFMFGARRRGSSNSPMGPAISEEDAGFQFPQQHQQPDFQNFGQQDQSHRRTESGGQIGGIMAEQVSYRSSFPVISSSLD